MASSPAITTPVLAVPQTTTATPTGVGNSSHSADTQSVRPPKPSSGPASKGISNLTVATWLGLGLAVGALIATVYFGIPMLQLAFWTASNDFREACWADRDHGVTSTACDIALKQPAMVPPGTLGSRDLYGWRAIVSGEPVNAPIATTIVSLPRRALAACSAIFAHTVDFLYSTEPHVASFKFAGGTHTFSAGTFETILAGLVAVWFTHRWLKRLASVAKTHVFQQAPAPGARRADSKQPEHPARSRTPWRLVELASMALVAGLILAWSLYASGTQEISGNCTGTVGVCSDRLRWA